MAISVLAAIFHELGTPPALYVDPGAGSLILQLVLGGIGGLALIGKLFWHRLRGVFGHKNRDGVDSEDSEG